MSQLVSIKCEKCGGEMQISSDQQVVCCPFCKSKNLIIESDDVKKTRLKYEHELNEKKLEFVNDTKTFLIGFGALVLLMIFGLIMGHI